MLKAAAIALVGILASCKTNDVAPDSLVIGSSFSPEFDHTSYNVSLFWSIPKFPEPAPILPTLPDE